MDNKMIEHNRSELNNRLLREKFNYVIEHHIEGGKKTLAIETLGYERENQVSNLCASNHKPSIKKCTWRAWKDIIRFL